MSNIVFALSCQVVVSSYYCKFLSYVETCHGDIRDDIDKEVRIKEFQFVYN